jgi:hypothetical protein
MLIKSKHNGWLADGTRTPFMGGGGGGPQTSKTETSNIPEYAKPYVMNMMGAAQNQLFNTNGNEITGFKPYTPYSDDPTDYFAGPSSLQRSTYGEAANMQTPGEYGLATGMGGMAGLGQLGAGQQFAQQATNPYAVQGYMSPYMQNVVDTQKSGAVRDFQLAQTARQGQQARQGAFGGSRGAIENAEAQRNLMSQMQGIQATGTQKAYEDAQRQQQFGANLNMQGLQGAAQTAGMLGQLGGARQQGDLARMGFQNQLGQQQQQYQQGIINQSIQDYATQQQYPYMQLSTMSNLLRGLPMQNMTTQGYQAAPNMGSQLIGAGATALGAYGASGGFRGFKAGGEVKSYAGGGIASSGIGAPTTGVAGSIERQLMEKEVPELIQIAKTNPSEQIREMAGRIAAAKQMQEKQAQSMGLEGAPAPNMDSMGMAGGGIVAFAGPDGSLVGELSAEDQEKVNKDEMLQRMGLMNRYLTSQGMGGQSPEAKTIGENIAEVRKGLGENYDNKNFYNALMLGGIGAMKGKSQNFLENIAGGLESGVTGYMKGNERKEDMLNKLRTGEIDLAKLNSTERSNLFRNITSGIAADETAKSRLEGVRYNTAMKNIESGKRDDARKISQDQKDEAAIQGLMKMFIGTANTNPNQEELDAARRKAIKMYKANPLGLERS